MSRPLAEWEQRALSYGVGAAYAYDRYLSGNPVMREHQMARLQASQRSAGRRFAPLTTGQKVSREISYLAAGGLAFRGLRGIHHGIKGAHGVALRLRSGKQLIRFRDRSSGRFVSEIGYRHRKGLPDKVLDPFRLGKAVFRKGEQAVAGSRTYRAYETVRSLERLVAGPQAYLIHRYTPRPVKVGYFLLGGYRWFNRFLDDSNEPETIPASTGPRAELNFILNQRLPPTLGGISRKKSGYYRTRSMSKTEKGCPPGHRWSSRLRKCVRVNRRRA
jgi:hypothetical protein